MTVRQISVFVENRTAGIASIIEDLNNAAIDIRAMSIADTTYYGILRLITDDPTKAAEVLSLDDQVVLVTEVLAVQVEDKPGALSRVLTLLSENKIDVEYLSAFVTRTAGSACVVLKVDNNDLAQAVLSENGIKLASSADLKTL